jgi:alcohol dehydrogenase
MYPRVAVRELVGLVHAGLLDLSRNEVTTFPLDAARQAVEHAAAHAAPFQRTAITP